MIDFLYNLHNFFGIPEMIIGQMDFIPVPIKEAIITVITFVPWLYFLYYAVELLERFFLKNLGKFLNPYLRQQYLLSPNAGTAF